MTDSQLNLNFINNNNSYSSGINVNLIGNNVDDDVQNGVTYNATELFTTTMFWLFNATQINESYIETTTTTQKIDLCFWNPEADNSHFNCSKEEFVLYYRGPKQLPLATALSVSKVCLL